MKFLPPLLPQKILIVSFIAALMASPIIAQVVSQSGNEASVAKVSGVTDASAYGFSPQASGVENTKALQSAVDQGGTIVVKQPGVYPVAGTVYIGGNTSLKFGAGIYLKKVLEKEPFSHVLLNKGAVRKTYDEHITVDGLRIIVNGVDVRTFKDAYGLHGQLAFFYVKDLRITHFQCLDLGGAQYGIQVCTFEDLLVDNVFIMGKKDGVHLGRGKRFIIRNATFETGDDAVALNGHDYDVGNPEMGWIEDGLVENCQDLANPTHPIGYFCRILAGAWVDWKAGMQVQKSDTVVSNGRLYRVQEKPDEKIYTSNTRPTHEKGSMVLDGIHWGMVQTDVTYTAGVRNVTFRHIVLEKPRGAFFSIHFDHDKYSRSYYPGATVPVQEGIVLDDVQVLCDQPTQFMSVVTPIPDITIMNSGLRNNGIVFKNGGGKTSINFIGCTFLNPGKLELLVNTNPEKIIFLNTTKSIVASDKFTAAITSGGAAVTVDSDLPGLKK